MGRSAALRSHIVKTNEHTPRACGEEPDLSVVVPAHNEAKVLPRLGARLAPVVSRMEREGFGVEVVFVNDGSSDDTLAVMKALGARWSRVRIVNLARRFGHQVALMAGLDNARGRAVAVLDADLQDPPELLLEMVRIWCAGHDVVYGVRRRRRGDSWFKRATASVFYRFLSFVAGDGVRPDVGDFYLMDRRVVEALRLGRSHGPFLRGALSRAGFRHIGLPYDRSPRSAGDTKYSFSRMVSLALDAVPEMTFRPLRLASLSGLILFLIGLVALVPMGGDIRALMLLLAGVQLMSVGLLGEYVGRTHAIVAGRPIYLVLDVIDPSISSASSLGGEAPDQNASETRAALAALEPTEAARGTGCASLPFEREGIEAGERPPGSSREMESEA